MEEVDISFLISLFTGEIGKIRYFIVSIFLWEIIRYCFFCCFFLVGKVGSEVG